MRLLSQLYISVGLLLPSQLLLAGEDDKLTTSSKGMATSPVTSDAVLQTLLGLGAILAIILALAWLIKRTGRFQSSPNGEIKVIAGIPLGTRERAVLLEVGGEKVLVGVTPQHIQTLHVLGKSSSTQADASFNDHLSDVLKKQSQ